MWLGESASVPLVLDQEVVVTLRGKLNRWAPPARLGDQPAYARQRGDCDCCTCDCCCPCGDDAGACSSCCSCCGDATCCACDAFDSKKKKGRGRRRRRADVNPNDYPDDERIDHEHSDDD